jgi:hypothetical protein
MNSPTAVNVKVNALADVGMSAPHGARDATIHDRFPAAAAARQVAEAAVLATVLSSQQWHNVCALLKHLAGDNAAIVDPPASETPLPPAVQEQSAADAIAAGQFVPADIQEIELHLQLTKGARHPRSADSDDPIGTDGAARRDRAASKSPTDCETQRTVYNHSQIGSTTSSHQGTFATAQQDDCTPPG